MINLFVRSRKWYEGVSLVEKKDYILTEDKKEYLELLKTAVKKDVKFAYALHSSLLARRMRSWGYQALRYLPKAIDKAEWNWMKGYPCGDYEELVFQTIKLHYPIIYEGLKSDIPSGYVQNFISENLYPFKVER